VIINLSEAASNKMLDTLGGMMDGGTIELSSDNGVTLAVLRLSNPAATAEDGNLVFNKIAEEDAALAQGNAMSARVMASDGSLIFTCSVGDEQSDSVIKLNSTTIHRNGPVRITSFRLGMA
jgi:hypothetical protein